MQKKVKELLENLNIQFNNIDIYKTALTHRSFINEVNQEIESNERLEFLGDAVLQHLSSIYLYQNHPSFTEGELTNLRSNIVNTQSLANESKRLKLYEYLLISKGEQETAATSDHILANTFEAILGAIYLDLGLERITQFLNIELFYKVKDIIEAGRLKDSKSLYQELVQEKYSTTPIYEVISEKGPDHEKEFVVGVYLNSKLIATGEGTSKRKAQQVAAEKALNIENITVN